MADSQPVVCAYLKLPPEQQIFFRMREIPLVFLEKLDRLTLALVASYDTQPCPEAIQILRDLRENTAEQCKKMSHVMFSGHRFATVYLEFLRALSPDTVGEETFLGVLRINNHSYVAARDMDVALKAMVKFERDIADAASRIATVLSDKSGPGNNLVTTENSQVVADFLHVANECSNLLRQSDEYYREIGRQTEDEESIKSNRPSEEEIEMMLERWTAFATSVRGLQDGFGPIIIKILRGGDLRRADGSYDDSQATGNAAPTGAPNQTDPPNGQKAILDASALDSSPSTGPKTSLWRSLLQRLLSCLTLKHFDKR